jgi:hypothetical protein
MSPEIITFVSVLILSPLLFATGRVLISMKSVKASLEAYEQDPKQASFTDKWILGWQVGLQRTVTRWSYNTLGDRFISAYYRAAGVFFLLLLAAIWILLAIQFLAMG